MAINMKLLDLEPQFIKYETTNNGEIIYPRGIPIEQAQGLLFLCPKCFAENKGPVGTHTCEVSFEGRGVLPHQGSHNKDGKPVRWNVAGSDLQNLTLTPSILLEGGCAWHGFITNGEVA
jgi:hypothetical protein